MPCKYIHKPGTKVYRKYSDTDFEKAIAAMHRGMSTRKAAAKYNIPRSVLGRRSKSRRRWRKQGGQPVLGDDVEQISVQRLQTCGQWGFPVDAFDLRMIVKGYLDRRGLVVQKFKNNVPGLDWTASFLHRHKHCGSTYVSKHNRATNCKHVF